MRFRRILTIFAVLTIAVACGPRDRIVSASAQATDSGSQHPLVGTWLNVNASRDLIVRSNGTTLSQTCGSQGTVGEVDELKNCGINSKGCGSFSYIVIGSVNDPACIEAGSYVCFYNVYTTAGQDYLALNCSDGKGISQFLKQP